MFYVIQWDHDDEMPFIVEKFVFETIEEVEALSAEHPYDMFEVRDGWDDQIGEAYRGKYSKTEYLTPR